TDDPNKNPDAKRIELVEEITEEIERLAGNRGSVLGTGGMITKINAAKMMMDAGIEMVVANGKNPEILYDILEGDAVCTRFVRRKNDN
ncbi:MAG: glutamate 5-kinase, partial [Ruminococcus sp.]|nr:glutamate 5-kinase [Ruminococcus sp.]